MNSRNYDLESTITDLKIALRVIFLVKGKQQSYNFLTASEEGSGFPLEEQR